MLLDTKAIPPPPYALSLLPPFPSSSRDSPINLTQFPSHILLQIIYATFPQTHLPDQDKIQRQRRNLYWLSISLRLVNRTLYVASMHVLRSTHIPAYNLLIRHPYSSDPFPMLPNSSSSSSSPTITTLQRETYILDRFIALKVREDVWADESELHLEREEAYKDLFDLAQPKSRIEDLVRDYGIRDGVVCIGAPVSAPATPTITSPITASKSGEKGRVVASTPLTPSPSSTSLRTQAPSTSFFSSIFSRSKYSTPPLTPQPQYQLPYHRPQHPITPIPFHLLSISFSSRRVGLIHHYPTKRTIVTVQRTRDEKLEVAAKQLIKELRIWLEEAHE